MDKYAKRQRRIDRRNALCRSYEQTIVNFYRNLSPDATPDGSFAESVYEAGRSAGRREMREKFRLSGSGQRVGERRRE